MVKNLKKLRRKAGLSQQQLADVIGVSQQSVNKYENHSIEPDISTLTALADCFGTSVDYLIGHTEYSQKIEPVSPYDLNAEEASLIDGFRLLSEQEKQSIEMIIHNYSSNKAG